MSIATERLAMSNKTNLELAPVPVAKKDERKVAVVKPLDAQAAHRQPAKTEAEPGACKVKDAGKLQPKNTAQDSTVQEPPVEEEAKPAIEPPHCDDEFYCSSYAEDIYLYLMESEKKECYVIKPGFLSHQPKVNATSRRVVVDWLVKVHQKFDMHHETLFIAVDTLDRYLQVL